MSDLFANYTPKTYTNDELSVTFDLSKCEHCGNCINELPAVFDRTKRPWINLSGATPLAIVNQVARCPSKALTVGSGTHPMNRCVKYVK